MNGSSVDLQGLLQRATLGEQDALAQLFDQFRDRLRRMIHVRLDRRVQARVSPSDVLQEAFLDLARRIHEYAQLADYPFFLWLRQLVGQRLIDIHRQHLAAQMRSAELEVSLTSGMAPSASALSLSGLLVDRLGTASQAAEVRETQATVQTALQNLAADDREILAMRHFEMLTNGEAAHLLGITAGAASKRYVRALLRVRQELSAHPDFRELFGASADPTAEG